ncbi:hypothetical protein BJV78DRAFT_944136 [Lactifluus subvellereus]|nr:hypothetical protein BJV78DRAFT_944136 [Lactifluus subvellereus]
MPGCSTTVTSLPFIGRLDRRALSRSTGKRRHSPIHTLNDDVLLDIFYFCEPSSGFQDEEEHDRIYIWRSKRGQNLHWWCKLAHVCRRWRYLILASPSRLRLRLLCRPLTPVANMLTHSPPLPLTIEYYRELTEKEQEGMLYALQHSDRVRDIALTMSSASLRRPIMAMDKQFPTLERLFIQSWDDNESLIFPETFQAPHLRYLALLGAVPAIGFPFTTAMNLVTLALHHIPPTAYFSPGSLFPRLSLIPQLESLAISLKHLDVDSQLSNINIPIMSQISAPLLKTLSINLFPQLTPLAVPHLLQFVGASENLVFRIGLLGFLSQSSFLKGYQHRKGAINSFEIWIVSGPLSWQVASVMQALGALHPVLSVIEQLALSCGTYGSSGLHNELDRTQWRELFRLFSSVNTLHVQNKLVPKVSRSLQSDDGEPPLELLPNLEELGYSAGGDNDDAFISFINERQRAGRPITLSIVDDSLFASEPPWL